MQRVKRGGSDREVNPDFQSPAQPQRKTSNTQHRTLNTERPDRKGSRTPAVGRWMLNVRCFPQEESWRPRAGALLALTSARRLPMRLRTWWHVIVLACTLSGYNLHAGGSGLNVLVVVNPNSPNSLELGNYYCERRQVPPQNVVRLRNWTSGNLGWT